MLKISEHFQNSNPGKQAYKVDINKIATSNTPALKLAKNLKFAMSERGENHKYERVSAIYCK